MKVASLRFCSEYMRVQSETPRHWGFSPFWREALRSASPTAWPVFPAGEEEKIACHAGEGVLETVLKSQKKT
jgi:hypothetical protein